MRALATEEHRAKALQTGTGEDWNWSGKAGVISGVEANTRLWGLGRGKQAPTEELRVNIHAILQAYPRLLDVHDALVEDA